MKRCLALLLMSLLGGCKSGYYPAGSYLSLRDQLAAAIPILQVVGLVPCYRRDPHRVGYWPMRLEECVRMQKPRRIRGMWIDEFEGSRFYEGVTDIAEAVRRARSDKGMAERIDFAKPFLRRGEPHHQSRMWALDFIGRHPIGRRNFDPGGYVGQVVVDHIILAKVVRVSTKQYIENE